MKNKYCRNLLNAPLLAFALATGIATAGTTETTTTAPAAPPAEDVVSGVLKLDFNSHFVSYGADVWGDAESMSDMGFNPMLELSFALPAGFTSTLGTWWDVNSKGDSPLGGQMQEIDVWAGLAYTYEKFTVGVTFQDWIYADATEEILDVKFAYDCLLAPSLTIHNRLGEGGSGGNEGTVLVLGLSHSIEAGPVTVSFPVSVAYFLEDDFHANSTDDGFGYASLGVGAALPLTAVADTLGDWTLNAGLNYYFTDDGVVGNPNGDDFLTTTVGLSLAF
ncbi:hypothetical protein JIN84_11805 [Luteolibacter yonseiensis]|uniref:Outer membrane beta-barrel porin/alpha-amylase n=1 Tax=Luteolibacter yonseiensis TaxID=1144680 RepID=A0A934R6H2_9BACT|nr:hypothetical protein [Luteolibacter yonseiensis]MBK1816300.1 hypothetical protein [Luteolibacter yonseiensis]